MPLEVDVLVVGAGLAGAVVAERLASCHGLRSLVIDRRRHVAGIAHDGPDRHGVWLHTYGPHYFRTDSTRVREYLDQFTAWRPARFRVLAWSDGRYWPFPINLSTFEQLLGRPCTSEEMEAALARWRVPIATPKSSEELILSQVGPVLFDKFYRGYTRKHWGCEARELDAGVCGRIPIRTDRNDSYLRQGFQALPAGGYTRLVERILDHPSIEVRLGLELGEARQWVRWRHLVYTGMLDELFDCRLGRLPYRSLRFEHQSFERNFVQPVVQVNYPNDHDFTRTVELKHVTGQRLPVTTVVREYPEAHVPGREAFYAVPAAAPLELYRRYRDLAAADRSLSLAGRLAAYRNLDMDQVIEAALDLAGQLGPRLREGAAARPASALTARSRRGRGASGGEPQVEVVVARHREGIAWTRKVARVARVHIYDKGGDLDSATAPWARVTSLENVGREAHTYLHHIISRWECLAPMTVFCQGRPFDHASDLHHVVRSLAGGERRVERGFEWLGFIIDTDDTRGRRLFVRWSRNEDGRELGLDRFCTDLFGAPPPQQVHFYPGGQFVVTAAQVRSRPPALYRRALALSRTFPDAAHCFERTWDRLFGVTGVDPAVLGGELCRYLKPIRRVHGPAATASS